MQNDLKLTIASTLAAFREQDSAERERQEVKHLAYVEEETRNREAHRKQLAAVREKLKRA